MEDSPFTSSLRLQFKFRTGEGTLTLILKRLQESNINILAMTLDKNDVLLVLGRSGEGSGRDDNIYLANMLHRLGITYRARYVSEVVVSRVGVPGTYYTLITTLQKEGLPIRHFYATETGSVIIDSSDPEEVNEAIVDIRSTNGAEDESRR